MVLGKLPVPGRPTNLDLSRARAYCACSRCGWGLFAYFSLVYYFSFLSPSLWETARYRLEIPSQRAVKPKTTTNQQAYKNMEMTRERISITLEAYLSNLASAL